MDDPFYLLSKCIYSRSCFIALLNGEYDKSRYIRPQYFKELDILTHTTDHHQYQNSMSVFVVNATCHLAIMKSFQVQFSELPALIHYNGNNENMNKKSKNTEFSVEEINKFLNNLNNISSVNNEIPLEKKKIEVNRVKCEQIKEHRDLNFKFDYGGREFEEDDEDRDNSINLNSDEGENIHEKYKKIFEEDL